MTDPYSDVYRHFTPWEGVVPAGYQAEFLGNVALIERFYPGNPTYIKKLAEQAREPGYRRTDMPRAYTPGYFETGAVLQAVLDARDSISMMELGAGMGPWTTKVARAAALRGIKNRFLVPVEAEPTRYEWLLDNLRINGVLPSEHAARRAVVFPSTQKDKEVLFPVGAPHFAGLGVGAFKEDTLYEYGDRKDQIVLEPAPVVSLRELLTLHPRQYDLIHMDIQGAELDVIKDAQDLITASIRHFCVETHSATIDAGLPPVFQALGWECRMSWGFWGSFEVDGQTVSARGFGGFQHWFNPALAAPPP